MPVASTDNNHDILHEVGRVIAVREGPLAAHNGHLFSTHLVEQRATNLEHPDIVERLQAVPSVEYPDLVLVRHSGVRASRRRNLLPRGECQPQPSPRRHVEGIYAVVV